MSFEPSSKQLHILQHSLGFDKHGYLGSKKSYRNYYCQPLDAACDSSSEIAVLCKAGMMELSHAINGGKDGIYIVTELGQKLVRQLSVPLPKTSKAKLRYRKWLEVGYFMSFGEWLRTKAYKHE